MHPPADDDPAALLAALQFADSAFPAGLYTLSHGLEGLTQLGEVGGRAGGRPGPAAVEARTAELLHSTLRDSLGPAESVAVACAWTAARAVCDGGTDPRPPSATDDGGDGNRATAPDDDRVTAAVRELAVVDAHLHAAQLCREQREGSARAGRQFADLAAELVDRPLTRAWAEEVRSRRTPGTLAVASGVVYACSGLGCRAAVAADLAALVNGYAGAALRLRLVDHRGAQRLVSGAAPVIAEVSAAAAASTDVEDIGGFAPLLDLACCTHETAEARLFAG